MVIVSDEPYTDLESFKSFSVGREESIEQGVYLYQTGQDSIVFLSSKNIDLESGTYCVLSSTGSANTSRQVQVLGKYYSAICQGRIKALLKTP